jgi:surface antigen
MMARLLLAATPLVLLALPVTANPVVELNGVVGGGSTALPPYLQCVPYARRVTGINIFGDAHTWWGQADGRYARGTRPKVGAVLALKPHGNSRLGHVAAVSRIVDARTILIRHSNWSTINGRRGQIEDNVKVIDVSAANDWSEVRVWYAPLQALGGTHWPVQGFIYSGKPPRAEPALRSAAKPRPALTMRRVPPLRIAPDQPVRDPIARIIAKKMRW